MALSLLFIGLTLLNAIDYNRLALFVEQQSKSTL